MSSEVFKVIGCEARRQQEVIELIASENFVSDDIKMAVGSCLTNKYAEGYPEKRYYGGCRWVDAIEKYCQQKWLEVFNCEDDYCVNVQPHSGSNANLAAYMTVLKPGDTVLAMSLENGGHLTHGSSANFSGKLYNFVFYGVDKFGYIDYRDLEEKMDIYKPKLVVAGASAYPRIIDFRMIRRIIDAYNSSHDIPCLFMVDMSHIAGLVATGFHTSPFDPFAAADLITTTTHKTLRGPRGALIFAKKDLEKKLNSAVFPGVQGGPLMHVIAGKAICAEEALTKEYKDYIRYVVINSNAMAGEFRNLGYDLVTDGTDNHLFLIDFSRSHPNLSGKDIQDYLDIHGITVNKNMVPNDKRGPRETSGIRIGTAAMTTRGYSAENFKSVARRIDSLINELNENVK